MSRVSMSSGTRQVVVEAEVPLAEIWAVALEAWSQVCAQTHDQRQVGFSAEQMPHLERADGVVYAGDVPIYVKD